MRPPVISPTALALLTSFSVDKLGEGDVVAGTNVLVSMCLAIAAVAGPGSSLTTPQDDRLAVGVNWLLTGALSQELHHEFVLRLLRSHQNTLSHNMQLTQLKLPAVGDAKKPLTAAGKRPDVLPSPFTPEVLASAQDRMKIDSLLSDGDSAEHRRSAASRFLDRHVLTEPLEFLRHPAFFHDGTDPKLLSIQLGHSHRGHPLVDFAIRDFRQAASAQPICSGIMDGCGLPTAFPSHVSGYVTARIPQEILRELVTRHPDVDWPLRMLWLDEAQLGTRLASQGLVRLDGIHRRFEMALRQTIEDRLGDGVAASSAPKGTENYHQLVRKHLAGLDAGFPGIAAALKNLFPTLVYGLRKLVSAKATPEGFTYSLDGIAELAMYLAGRMAVSYALCLHGEELAKVRLLAGKILRKLEENGPATERAMSRQFDRLLMEPCREAFALLEREEKVSNVDGKWVLVAGTPAILPPPTDVP